MTDNKEGIVIERVFDAPRELVWKAWTDPEMIKKWWGPEGFTAPSAKVDLQVGGRYTYAMRGPDGTQFDKVMYSSGEYKEIVPLEKIVTTDYLSDENGESINPSNYGMPDNTPNEMIVIIRFEDTEDGKTKLTIEYPRPETEEQFEAMLKSGMKEGWTSSMNKFAECLK